MLRRRKELSELRLTEILMGQKSADASEAAVRAVRAVPAPGKRGVATHKVDRHSVREHLEFWRRNREIEINNGSSINQ